MKYPFYIITLMIIGWTQTNAQSLLQTELLGRPTDKSITVQAFFDSPVEACIQYGTTNGVYPNQTAWQTFAAGEPTKIVVSGLQTNTKYVYRMCYRTPNTTTVTTRPENKFQTQRAKGSTFSFIVQADPHMDAQSDTALYRLALNNQLGR